MAASAKKGNAVPVKTATKKVAAKTAAIKKPVVISKKPKKGSTATEMIDKMQEAIQKALDQ